MTQSLHLLHPTKLELQQLMGPQLAKVTGGKGDDHFSSNLDNTVGEVSALEHGVARLLEGHCNWNRLAGGGCLWRQCRGVHQWAIGRGMGGGGGDSRALGDGQRRYRGVSLKARLSPRASGPPWGRDGRGQDYTGFQS